MVRTNPFLLAAAVVAVCIYCPFLDAGKQPAYASLVPLGVTRSIDCRLCSGPAKGADLPGAAYRCSAAVIRSSGDYGPGCVASASSGRLVLSIPPALVESLYPGRLYSAATEGFLMEAGASFRFSGHWNREQAVFEVDGAQSLGWGKGLFASFCRIRACARLHFRRMLYSWGRAGGLALALLSGSRDYLAPSLVESFRRSGLSHVLALSGMHLSFFSSIMGGTAVRLFGRRHAFLFRLLAISLFVFFAGFSPSLFRAFLFTILLSLCGRFCVSGLDGRAVLGAVFLLHVLLRPEDLLTPAFMLSYAAIAGILFLSAPIGRLLAPILPPAIALPLASSAAAFVATAPLSCRLFGCVAPVGILAGIAVSPLVGLFLLLSLASLAVSLAVPALSPLCASLMGWLYFLIDRAAALFSLVPPLTFG